MGGCLMATTFAANDASSSTGRESADSQDCWMNHRSWMRLCERCGTFVCELPRCLAQKKPHPDPCCRKCGKPALGFSESERFCRDCIPHNPEDTGITDASGGNADNG